MATANLSEISDIKKKIDECDRKINILKHHISHEKAENPPDYQRINIMERKICHYELQKNIEQEKLDKLDRI